MIKKTRKVLRDTAENYSSMFQSFKRGKKTEVDSINGYFKKIGRKKGVNTSLNSLLRALVKALEVTF